MFEHLIARISCSTASMLAAMLLSPINVVAAVPERNALVLSDVVISPSGDRVAFTACRQNSSCVIGLYDVESGVVSALKNPHGWQLKYPSFSHDGERIVATMLCDSNCDEKWQEAHIVVFAKDDQQPVLLTSGPGFRGWPVFQPNSGDILFIDQTISLLGPKRRHLSYPTLSLLVVSSGDVRTVMAGARGQYLSEIFRPAFVEENRIVFSGILSSKSPLHAVLAKTSGERPRPSEILGFELSLGKEPQLMDLAEPAQYRGSSISASQNGERIIFVKRVSGQQAEGRYSYDLFENRRGNVERLTNLATHFGGASISYNGLRVAFLADDTGMRNFDLFIFDTTNRSIKRTEVRSHIQSLANEN